MMVFAFIEFCGLLTVFAQFSTLDFKVYYMYFTYSIGKMRLGRFYSIGRCQ